MLCICGAEVEAGLHEDRLLKRFFHDNQYFPTSRPVADDSDSVLVKFSVTLLKTFELVTVSHWLFVIILARYRQMNTLSYFNLRSGWSLASAALGPNLFGPMRSPNVPGGQMNNLKISFCTKNLQCAQCIDKNKTLQNYQSGHTFRSTDWSVMFTLLYRVNIGLYTRPYTCSIKVTGL